MKMKTSHPPIGAASPPIIQRSSSTCPVAISPRFGRSCSMRVSMPTRLPQSCPPQALLNNASFARRWGNSTARRQCPHPQFSSSAAPSSAPPHQLRIPFPLHGNLFSMEWKSASQRKTRTKALKGASPNDHTIDAAKTLVIALEGRLQAQALARHLGRRALARNLASRLARCDQAHPMVTSSGAADMTPATQRDCHPERSEGSQRRKHY